ncbi:MAG: chorismate synthase [Clostridia bacterium]|nr:chorismate synthase [Clostridia bacterium]
MSFNIVYFGTSHGPEVGVRAQDFIAGEEFSISKLQHFLDRRRPGTSDGVSARKESDIPEFRSGVAKKDSDTLVTTGEMLEAVIKNEDANTKDYEDLKYTPRPGHADYTAFVKYGENCESAGGGQFSGRLTAPLCVLGGICLQALEKRGITITAVIDAMGDAEHAKAEGDSVGGIVKTEIRGLPAGVGGPFDGGLESRLASALFAIPAVKGVEFGAGFAAAAMKGSESNDPFAFEDGRVITKTNNCGGILGGISTGMPVTFRVAFKPTPSIALPQQTVNLKTNEETTITVKGRHDACIVPRALPAVEAAAAIVILEILNEENRL